MGYDSYVIFAFRPDTDAWSALDFVRQLGEQDYEQRDWRKHYQLSADGQATLCRVNNGGVDVKPDRECCSGPCVLHAFMIFSIGEAVTDDELIILHSHCGSMRDCGGRRVQVNGGRPATIKLQCPQSVDSFLPLDCPTQCRQRGKRVQHYNGYVPPKKCVCDECAEAASNAFYGFRLQWIHDEVRAWGFMTAEQLVDRDKQHSAVIVHHLCQQQTILGLPHLLVPLIVAYLFVQ